MERSVIAENRPIVDFNLWVWPIEAAAIVGMSKPTIYYYTGPMVWERSISLDKYTHPIFKNMTLIEVQSLYSLAKDRGWRICEQEQKRILTHNRPVIGFNRWLWPYEASKLVGMSTSVIMYHLGIPDEKGYRVGNIESYPLLTTRGKVLVERKSLIDYALKAGWITIQNKCVNPLS